MTEEITTNQFEEMLAKHDWYYSSSDDPRSWTRGLKELTDIQRLCDTNPTFKKLYEQKENRFLTFNNDSMENKEKKSKGQIFKETNGYSKSMQRLLRKYKVEEVGTYILLRKDNKKAQKAITKKKHDAAKAGRKVSEKRKKGF